MSRPGLAPSASRRRFLWLSLALAAATPFGASAAEARKLKIGIIGSGRVGGTLGAAWLAAGHQVMFSSLDLEQDKALAAKLGAGASAGTPREAAAYGEVLLVSVPYSALPQLGKELGDLVKGKIIIDTSNPVASRDGEIVASALEKGPGLTTAALLPGARIVRGFNAIGYTRMQEFARTQSRTVGMPIAGDDANAIAIASGLVREAGLEPVLIGPLAMGRHLRPGTPLAGEHSPEQIRKIAATLK